MTAADAAQVLAIYQAGLDGGEASFEIRAPAWEAFDATRLPGHRHVAVNDASGEVLGWAAACAVSDRCVYQGVVEHSVYVAPAARGRGSGPPARRPDQLHRGGRDLDHPVRDLPRERRQPAPARAGRVPRGRHPGAAGRHHGRWRDVVLLERRSPRGRQPDRLLIPAEEPGRRDGKHHGVSGERRQPGRVRPGAAHAVLQAWTAAPSGVKSLTCRRLAGIVARGIHSPAKNIRHILAKLQLGNRTQIALLAHDADLA